MKANITGSGWKSTDTHWRSQSGFGCFNWRLKFRVTFPIAPAVLTLQAWDKDIIGRDELIGECQLDFEHLAKFAFEHQKRTKIMIDKDTRNLKRMLRSGIGRKNKKQSVETEMF